MKMIFGISKLARLHFEWVCFYNFIPISTNTNCIFFWFSKSEIWYTSHVKVFQNSQMHKIGPKISSPKNHPKSKSTLVFPSPKLWGLWFFWWIPWHYTKNTYVYYVKFRMILGGNFFGTNFVHLAILKNSDMTSISNFGWFWEETHFQTNFVHLAILKNSDMTSMSKRLDIF